MNLKDNCCDEETGTTTTATPVKPSSSSSSSLSLWSTVKRTICLPLALALVFYIPLLKISHRTEFGTTFFQTLGTLNKFGDGSTTSNSNTNTNNNNGVVTATLADPLTRMAATSSYQQQQQPSYSSSSSTTPSSSAGSSIGRRIVERAYNESFVDLVQYCHKGNQTAKELQGCISHFFGATRVTSLPYAQKWPWWFQTLLRDAAKDPELYQPWHQVQFQTPNPNLQLCVIEKIGSKQFFKFHCKANNITNQRLNKNCYKEQGPLLPLENSDRGVFLRDPLERFLSGFINKCIERRDDQEHCQPLQVFENHRTTLVSNFYSNPQKLFEAYVDAMPLTWDLHFLPQSLYCGGLYNNLRYYNFVGNMGDSFYQDIDRFGTMYPRLDSYLRDQFPPRERQGNAKLLEYYTPTTVQKVLEYHAIDYMLLGMEIPTWAETVLLQHPMITALVVGH